MNEREYFELNKKLWNDKVDYHFKSQFYGVEQFLKGESTLNEIELNLLGEIKQKSLLHLQCHFGLDSLSLARLGAQITGVDFSEKAIEKANELKYLTNLNAEFVLSNIYELPEKLNHTFDLVFSSYGTIGWLPDINRWAKIVAHFLKPGGKFIFVEFHPVRWMFSDDFASVQYGYFHGGAIVEEESGTYADANAPLKNISVGWNHTLSDVIQALINEGLGIENFQEFNFSPYPIFIENAKIDENKFAPKGLENKLPLVYALKAIKH